ncbi:spore coat protein U domain-containing protein [Brenneria izadpanahii]|uniref:Spore coat protein U domain-containing protein n=1 Tax=Brenneria izadpanahii TaxID=2722756 RepID=A0ABX7UTK5_9GAMM|nr:spore coat U domain-containing protein [Brenneria izadpanahii]QTF07702.1 spore coat protein U domain-containing protein [Brenneria izadpanahii]
MNAKKTLLPPLVALFTLGGASVAHSETVTGNIGVTLTITTACAVDSGTSSGSTWGTIDFGTHDSLATNIDGQVTSTSGNGLTVTCSTGTPATVRIGTGANDNSSLRTLASSGGTYNIPYRLYTDANMTTEIPLNDADGIALTATGSAQSIPVHARILPSDQTILAPSAGTYTDTVAATVEW